jgi:YD repeat-containing protein
MATPPPRQNRRSSTYDPDGNLASESDPNGIITAYSYDNLNELTDETVASTTTSQPVFAEHTDWDDDGQKADVIDTRYNGDGSVFSKTQTSWTYDAMDRLTGETLEVEQGSGTGVPTAYANTFAYDLSSNRTEEDIDGGDGESGGSSIRYHYNDDDQLTSETETTNGTSTPVYQTTYTYDADGNLATQTRTGSNAETGSYSYDLRNRMTASTEGTTTTTYTYDTSGVLSSQSSGGATTYYLNDPNNPTGYTKAVEQSTTLGGSPTLSYVLGLKVEAQANSASTPQYLITDGHSSTRVLTDAFGNVLQTYDYDAFGTALDFDPSTADTTSY